MFSINGGKYIGFLLGKHEMNLCFYTPLSTFRPKGKQDRPGIFPMESRKFSRWPQDNPFT